MYIRHALCHRHLCLRVQQLCWDKCVLSVVPKCRTLRTVRSSPRISLSRVPVSAAVAAVDMLMTPSTLLLNLSAVDCSPSDVNRTVGASTSAPVSGGGVLAVRQTINLLLLPLTMATLASGGTKCISLLLSAVVGLMIVCFATALGSNIHQSVVPQFIDSHGCVLPLHTKWNVTAIAALVGFKIPRNYEREIQRRCV